jgi:hypothetical protein
MRPQGKGTPETDHEIGLHSQQPDTLLGFPATWRSGYAAACKAVYTGSIPVVASPQRSRKRGVFVCSVSPISTATRLRRPVRRRTWHGSGSTRSGTPARRCCSLRAGTRCRSSGAWTPLPRLHAGDLCPPARRRPRGAAGGAVRGHERMLWGHSDVLVRRLIRTIGVGGPWTPRPRVWSPEHASATDLRGASRGRIAASGVWQYAQPPSGGTRTARTGRHGHGSDRTPRKSQRKAAGTRTKRRQRRVASTGGHDYGSDGTRTKRRQRRVALVGDSGDAQVGLEDRLNGDLCGRLTARSRTAGIDSGLCSPSLPGFAMNTRRAGNAR